MRPSATEIMRSRLPSLRRVTLCVLVFMPLLAALFPLAASAQDDAPSLGDLARNLRKNKSQQQPQQPPDAVRTVIDNDNPELMRSRLPSLRRVTLCVLVFMPLLAALFPLAASAQDDAPSLGDLAREH